MKRPIPDRERFSCPHCGARLATRSTRRISTTCREKYLQCENVACGATFGASSEITHQISPSACPNPRVALRTSAPRRRSANDDFPDPANDGEQRGPEVPPAPADADASHARSPHRV